MTVMQTAPLSDDEAIQAQYEAKMTATTGGTGNHTLTTAEFIEGIYSQADGGAAANITTPTAAAIVAAIVGPVVGTSFRFVLMNNDAGDAMTLVGGTSVTVKGTAAVAATKAAMFVANLTNVTAGSEAVTVYRCE